MKNLKISASFLFFFLSLSLTARVRDFETTRLKSTAGAGIGSLLLHESVLLNPAPVAFFEDTSLYFQRSWLKLSSPHSSRNFSERSFKKDSHQTGLIMADTRTKIKGAGGLIFAQEGREKRKRLSTSVATRINKKASFGLLYHYTEDQIEQGATSLQKQKYHKVDAGFTYVPNDKFILGAVFQNAFKGAGGGQRYLVGAQYLIGPVFALLADAGGNTAKSISNATILKTGLQVTALKDIFFRIGFFDDKDIGEKGYGYGVSWLSPKLTLELAFKYSKPNRNTSDFFMSGEELKETNFSVAYRF
ncbi:MAG: hypothetical protein KBD63_07540 [Bacteriovoracaceae bacterium]|nr:hypothetical protein [Bacteriovoracaceae bacterium]